MQKILDESNMCTLDLQYKNVNTYINFAFNQLVEKWYAKDSDFNPDKLLKEDFQRFNNFRDWFCVMETAKNEGIAEGEAIGLQKGRAKEKQDVARNLKALNVDLSTIVAATGLTEDEIKEL